jgi:hypothetical protein
MKKNAVIRDSFVSDSPFVIRLSEFIREAEVNDS